LFVSAAEFLIETLSMLSKMGQSALTLCNLTLALPPSAAAAGSARAKCLKTHAANIKQCVFADELGADAVARDGVDFRAW
jgi:hypothetical protein